MRDFFGGVAAAAVGLSTTLVGLVLQSFTVGLFTFYRLALTLIGVPHPLALGLWVGLVSQFVPTVGTYLAGALPVLIALFHEPVDAVWVLSTSRSISSSRTSCCRRGSPPRRCRCTRRWRSGR